MIYLGKSPAFKSSSAMAADTGALFWFAPDSIDSTGTTINSWDDKTANGYDLSPKSGVTPPTYDSSGLGSVSFATSRDQALSNTTFAAADSYTQTITDGGELRIFFVVTVGFLDNSTENRMWFMTTGTGDPLVDDNSSGFAIDERSSNTAINIRTTSRRLFGIQWSQFISNQGGAHNLFDAGIAVISFRLDQTDIQTIINDSAFSNSTTNTYNPSDDPTDATLNLGSRINGTTVSEGYSGKIHEVFATSTTDNEAAVRAELIAKYGIT